jgi:hypothetical protein
MMAIFPNRRVVASTLPLLLNTVGVCRLKELYQTEIVSSPNLAESHQVHGLPNEVQAEATGTKLIEFSTAPLPRLNRHTLVPYSNFESIAQAFTVFHFAPEKEHLDGTIENSVIGMANDIGKGFVHRQYNQASIGRG